MHACDVCGEEFETLSRLRLEHEPCPVEERERKREEAIQQLRDERGIDIGEQCRVISTGREVTVVDVEPSEGADGEPTIVWVPADEPDTPEQRHRSPADEIV